MVKTTACPECGSVDYINENLLGEGYRVCENCDQDWWVDVKYEAVKTVVKTNTCKWHLEEKDGYNLEEHDYWETSCDNLFQFNAGGPENNRFKFCPYCGKSIEEVEEC